MAGETQSVVWIKQEANLAKKTLVKFTWKTTLKDFKLYQLDCEERTISKASVYVKKNIFRKSFQETHLRGYF